VPSVVPSPDRVIQVALDSGGGRWLSSLGGITSTAAAASGRGALSITSTAAAASGRGALSARYSARVSTACGRRGVAVRSVGVISYEVGGAQRHLLSAPAAAVELHAVPARTRVEGDGDASATVELGARRETVQHHPPAQQLLLWRRSGGGTSDQLDDRRRAALPRSDLKRGLTAGILAQRIGT
jgi:hypothetical protein